MTLSTSTGRQITVGQLIADAWRTASVVEISQEPSPAQKGYGRRVLDRILDALQTQGVFARSVRLYNLSLSAGEHEYTLPAWVADVTGRGAYIRETDDPDLPESTFPVEPMSREEYQGLTNLQQQANPSRYYLQEDVDPLVIRIWPRPLDDGIIRLQVKRHLSDIENDTNTIDLQRYWMRYLEFELAAHFALQTSQQREFFQLAARELQKCREESNEEVVGQFYIDHEVPQCI